MGKEIDQGLMAALASWFGRRMFQSGLELSAQSITKVMSDRAVHTTGAAGRISVKKEKGWPINK